MADCSISAIYTYPVKSCAALSHDSIQLDERGPVWDRRWMVVDTDGMFFTQREFPSLALIQPRFDDGCLYLTAPGMPEIGLPLERAPGQVKRVVVWRDTCDAWDEGDDMAGWLSDYLHSAARLVRMADGYPRPVDPAYARQPAIVSFADAFPLLIVSEASLDELNRRLQERGKAPVPMNRFRPNLVICGSEAFAEDAWRTVQIGEVMLDVVKPCARCVTTTVDQTTGLIPDKAEPLATLSTFRKMNGKVMFAQNAIHRAPGSLHIGDALTVLEA